ncbi:2-oxo acid dehydrogenase subunit E2 [Candidatus Pelagibacter bacterium]|nr:2-oxo acid dehydrogenase subunit E2 [Candidatus Pelagibacter bacterium]MDA8764724.1 2-oxo acid dehydrogenase subunit E2 [Candidatus Pelagibacter bacterium]MDA8772362.1 2-oxo acid dehydrogenase subunit E2 [Candidatus Pelagibacter bacterium]MDC0858554.1 2-oxo acid dehydrogenase subunit E2 [Pelagibacteraceae bacterium]MDC1124634.1 2-oxo acid dehydrogenase subunit E2 [Pelagibacteraceae bacterium]
MANLKIIVPDMGDFKDVEVIEVLVKDGQTINKNDSIITLESDKSSVEVPSTHSGKIEKVNVSVGDKINKGDLILTLDSKEKKEEIKKEELKKENKVDVLVPAKEATTKNLISPIPLSGKGSASPKVRRFARELGADVSIVPGTQRSGRVSEDDVKKFIRSQVTVSQGAVQKKETSKHMEEYPHEEFGEVSVKDIPRVKKLSGPHLVRSWTEIPHVTQHEEIDITEMEQFRSSLYDYYTSEKIKVTPLAFIAKALVSALKEFPNFNASIDVNSSKITYKKYFHIGFAVDTPHGLMVPKIRNVNEMSIQKIGEELKNTSKLCRELKIDKKEFFGGSMTISSLGGIGGTHFTPIINPPEVAILGVGKNFDRLVKENGKIVSRKILPISLSYDHRIIDGAEGARFCVYLGKCLGKDFAFKLAV